MAKTLSKEELVAFTRRLIVSCRHLLARIESDIETDKSKIWEGIEARKLLKDIEDEAGREKMSLG